jgi:hypothetical protein
LEDLVPKDTYLTIQPADKDLQKEIANRAECANYQKYSTCCDETFRRLGDWCSGCLFKAVYDRFFRKDE